MHYGLAPDVHLADVDGDLVLLDARANAYFCVPRNQAQGVKAALIGNNRFRPSVGMIEELEAAGLFTTIDAPADATPPQFRATTDLHQVPGDRMRLTPRGLARLLHAAAMAHVQLRLFRPRHWFRRAIRCNARASAKDRIDILAVARLAHDAQPFLPATSGCLPSSLFLLNLLHRHGHRARWVFGVRTYPFEAHCWVEHDGIVLNDSIEHVRWFTPIVAL